MVHLWIPSDPLLHMMQLDALRGFAVLAVLVGHFIRTTSSLFHVVKLVDLAGLSIRRFFVISGFFIIGIPF